MAALDALLAAAAAVFEAAVLDALLSATGRGPWPGYADLVPAARQGWDGEVGSGRVR